jgi:hypothetical protein
MSGYLLSNGTDLSFVFQSGSCLTSSGFILNNGNDMCTIFKAINVNHGYKTGFIYSAGKDISSLFDAKIPIPLTITGCSLWMDASDTSKMTLINTTSVNTWTDKSTNEYLFTSGTNKPTLTSQNGRSTILFNSANLNYLQGNPASTSFSIGTKAYSLFVVFKRSGNGAIYNKSLYGATNNRIICVFDAAGQNCGFQHANGIIISNTVNNLSSYQIISLTINRNEGKDTSYVNGAYFNSATYTSDIGTNYTATGYYMYIGAYNNNLGSGIQSGYYLNGEIAEIISYTTTSDMPNSTRQVIEGYLAWKWGVQSVLPISHPYYKDGP